MHARCAGVIASVVAVLSLSGTALGQATIIGLGDFPGGQTRSQAWAVSADGTTATGSSISNLGETVFRWRQSTGLVDLGDIPGGGYSSVGRAISSDGSFIVGSGASASGNEAFLWSSAGFVPLGDLAGGFTSSTGLGVSGDGSIAVGWSGSSNGIEAFRWTQATGMVGLGDLPGGSFNSQATGVSQDGLTIIGFSTNAVATPPVRWTSAGIEALKLPDGSFVDSDANGVSADGSVIVGRMFLPGGPRAFRWTLATGMVNIGTLPGGGPTNALAVSGDGNTIVGISNGRAFYWTVADGMRDLNVLLTDLGADMAAWNIQQPLGLNHDGTVIVGYGDHNPQIDAFIATLPAPPAVGACCHGSTCTANTQSDCAAAGGVFRGDGTACSTGDPGNHVECCPANFDEQSGVEVPDIFAFLSAWFANDPRADFDGNGVREVPDIFAFLSAWFAGCS